MYIIYKIIFKVSSFIESDAQELKILANRMKD